MKGAICKVGQSSKLRLEETAIGLYQAKIQQPSGETSQFINANWEAIRSAGQTPAKLAVSGDLLNTLWENVPQCYKILANFANYA